MRKLFLLTLLLISQQSFAVTYFVRPTGACTFNGNGQAYACAASGGGVGAWIGTTQVVYGGGAGQVHSGDTLTACGSFSEEDGTSNATISSDSQGVDVSGNCSASGDLAKARLTASSGVNYGIVCSTNANCQDQTWHDFAIDGYDTRGLYFRNDLSPSATANFTAYNIIVTNTLGTDTGPQAIFAAGTNQTFYNIKTNRSSDDAIHAEGDNVTVRDSVFIDPGYNVTTDSGDCVQVINAADNALITRNLCYHTNSSTKQCFILTGDENLTTGDAGATDDNAEISDNECYYPLTAGGVSTITKPIYSSVPNTKVLRNFVSGGYFGIYLMGAGSSAIGNVLVGQLNRGIDTVDTTTTGTKTVTGNTVIGSVSECYHIGGNGNTVNVSNNAASGCGTGYVKNGTPTVTQSNNAVFNSTTSQSGSFGTIDVTTNPSFVGGLTLTTAQGARLKANSPLRRVGKDLNAGNVLDHGDRAFLHPPSIGAWEAGSGDLAAERTAR